MDFIYQLCMFVFMERKSQQAYIDVWLKIKQLFFRFYQKPLQIQKMCLGFEKTAHNAILEDFNNCVISGCRFRFIQAWYRRIQIYKCCKSRCIQMASTFFWF